jgi:hypothetical protein
MAHQFSTNYIEDSIAIFRQYKRLAEKAMEQVTDEQLNFTLDPESNSIAIIVKHLAGNMRSRWTDFLTTDGEKPTRHRDTEFESDHQFTRAEVMEMWEKGWACLFSALEPLGEVDLARKVTIRSEPHSIMQAINRQMAHYSSHIGQIIFVAKYLRSKEWKTLSIPRGQSYEFLEQVKRGEKSQR